MQASWGRQKNGTARTRLKYIKCPSSVPHRQKSSALGNLSHTGTCIFLHSDFSLNFRMNHCVKKYLGTTEKFKERFPGQIPHYFSFHKLPFSLAPEEFLMQHCKYSNEIQFSLQSLCDHLIIILQSGPWCSLSISGTTIHLSHFLSLSEAIPTLFLSLIIFLVVSSGT